MNAKSTKAVVLPVAGLVLTLLLQGCGGGGLDDEPEPATPERNASFNAAAEYCGVAERMPYTGAGDKGSLEGMTMIRRDGMEEFGSVTYHRTGYVPIPGQSPSWLRVDMGDVRNWVKGGGLAYPWWTMGVQTVTEIPAGGIACVAPAAWLRRPRTQAGTSTISWESFAAPRVPVELLPGHPVDGFELIANFALSWARTRFHPRKEDLPDPSGVQVCHLPAGGASWRCLPPAVYDANERWTIAVEEGRAGVYVLTSPLPK